MRKALAALDLFTFFGRINFDAQGQVSVAPGFKPGVVIQIQNGRPATVWPPQAATAQLVYPTPSWAERLGLAAAPPTAPLPGTGLPPIPG